MPGVHTFYDGSDMLKPLAYRIGLEVDMINLVAVQVVSVPLALIYRLYLPPVSSDRSLRLLYPFVWGIILSYFCYGFAIKHILGLIAVSYSIMRFSPTEYVHKLVFIFAMSYLVFIHWFRWYVLTSYYIDITGPMMVCVQKVTTMAFSLHDGRVKSEEELTEIQKHEKLSEVPSVLEYLSYIFAFQTICTGPLCFYADYCNFIDGHDMTHAERERNTPWRACSAKFAFALVCMALVGSFHNKLSANVVVDKRALRAPLLEWWLLVIVVTTFKRLQYYYAWSFADAVANLSGFGFNGYDENKVARWDLISNVNAWNVELEERIERLQTALSFKETLDNWNCTTMYWLRRVAFERVPKNMRTFSTYLLSAMWHGVFAGYYLTFLTGALFTVSARNVRRCVRHRFQTTWAWARFYDVLTFIATKFALACAVYPFVGMHLNPGLHAYRHTYFLPHIIALLGAVLVPMMLPPPPRPKKEHTA